MMRSIVWGTASPFDKMVVLKETIRSNLGASPSVVFDRLISWTESEDPGIKYSFGSAVYQNTFKVTAKQNIKDLIPDLGRLAGLR